MLYPVDIDEPAHLAHGPEEEQDRPDMAEEEIKAS